MNISGVPTTTFSPAIPSEAATYNAIYLRNALTFNVPPKQGQLFFPGKGHSSSIAFDPMFYNNALPQFGPQQLAAPQYVDSIDTASSQPYPDMWDWPLNNTRSALTSIPEQPVEYPDFNLAPCGQLPIDKRQVDPHNDDVEAFTGPLMAREHLHATMATLHEFPNSTRPFNPEG